MRLLQRRGPSPAPSNNPSLERGKREECLATFWTQATPGTSFWRCVVPARHLPAQALQFRLDDLKEEKGRVVFPRQRGDVAIWQFLGDKLRSRAALGQRDKLGVRTLMEVDDNYTTPPAYLRRTGQYGTWTMTIKEAGNGYSFEGHRVVSGLVDGIICSTEYLADVYSTYNENVYHCPNSIDPEDWQFEREESETFRIAYYGSPSHVMDTPLVTKALKWAARQPGVEVWTVGFENPGWTWAHAHPWMESLEDSRKSLFRFDLGVAPLKPNPWANGKSDLKALEYGMAGVLPLMSNVEPFRYWEPRFPELVLDDDGWMEAIRWAVFRPDEVKHLADVFRAYVLRNRTIEQSIHLWREALHA